MSSLRNFWGITSRLLNATLAPLYRATDREFTTSVGPDGQTKVSHVKTAAANVAAAREELKNGHWGPGLKDTGDALFHGTFATLNRSTGLDCKMGMDCFDDAPKPD